MNPQVIQYVLQLIPLLQQRFPQARIPWQLYFILIQGIGTVKYCNPQELFIFIADLQSKYPQLPAEVFLTLQHVLPQIQSRIQGANYYQVPTQPTYQQPLISGYSNSVPSQPRILGGYNSYNP